MSASVQRVVVSNDEFTVPCPFCTEYGTHLGTCHLSQMHTGEVYAIVAKRVTLPTRADRSVVGAPSSPGTEQTQ